MRPVRGLAGRDLVCLSQTTPDEFAGLLALAADLKKARRARRPHALLRGRTLAMVFQKPSLRTRVSFEAGMTDLGGHAVYLAPDDIRLGVRETVADVARTLERYADAILARVFAHDHVVGLAEAASVPVINGLSDRVHPCQAIADLLTLRERRGKLKGLKLAYLGDGNNVCHSLLHACALSGMRIAVATPPSHPPRADVLAEARAIAARTGARIEATHDAESASSGADALYTDVWASMGQEQESGARAQVFPPYRLDRDKVARAAKDAIVLHCLPAHRGEEIAADVMDGPRAAVFDQAENRLHAQKALLVSLLSHTKR